MRIIYNTRLESALRALKSPRGWCLGYQGPCIDPMDQSHPLDLTLKASEASATPTIRLLKNDKI